MCGHFLGGNGKTDGDQVNAFVFGGQFGLKFPTGRFVIVGYDGYLISKLQFIFTEKGIDFFLDGITDAVFKIVKRFLSFRRNDQMGAVADGTRIDQAGIDQICDGLLQRQKICIFPFQNEIPDLGLGEWKSNPVQHIKYDQFIKCKWFLCHENPSPARYVVVCIPDAACSVRPVCLRKKAVQ